MIAKAQLGLWLNIFAFAIFLASATPLPLEVTVHDVTATANQDTLINLPEILDLDIDKKTNLIPLSNFPTIPPSSNSKAPPHTNPHPHPQNLLARGEDDSTSPSTPVSPKKLTWVHSYLNAPNNPLTGENDSASPSGYTRNIRWSHSTTDTYPLRSEGKKNLQWEYLNAASTSDPTRGVGDDSTSTPTSTSTNNLNWVHPNADSSTSIPSRGEHDSPSTSAHTKTHQWVHPNAPHTRNSNPTPPIGGGHPSSTSPLTSTTNVQWMHSTPSNLEPPVEESDRQQKQREYRKTLKKRRRRQQQLLRSGEFDRILSLSPGERNDLLLWNRLMKEGAQGTPEPHPGPNPTGTSTEGNGKGKGKGKGREDPQGMADGMNMHQDSGPSSLSRAHYMMNPHQDRYHGPSSSSSSNQHQHWGDGGSRH